MVHFGKLFSVFLGNTFFPLCIPHHFLFLTTAFLHFDFCNNHCIENSHFKPYTVFQQQYYYCATYAGFPHWQGSEMPIAPGAER